jgi:hypothetical protein
MAGPTAFATATAVEQDPPYMSTAVKKAPPYISTIAAGALAIARAALTIAAGAVRLLAAAARLIGALNFVPVLKVAWRISMTVALVASVITLAVLGRGYWTLAMQSQTAAKVRAAAAFTPPQEPKPAVSKSTGQLHITADPASARVTIDGKPRGVTPLLVEHLKVGTHSVVLQSVRGDVEESVTITAGETQELSESIYPGWLTLFAPFDVVISERGRAIALDEKHQLLLAPGAHDLRVENRALGYVETRHVDMKPGDVASISIAPPKSTMTVTSSAPAQVFLDGTLVGETPVDVPADLGMHALVVKYADGEQRQRSVTVTAKPLVVEM